MCVIMCPMGGMLGRSVLPPEVLGWDIPWRYLVMVFDCWLGESIDHVVLGSASTLELDDMMFGHAILNLCIISV
jgi:hypothetical protein